MHKEWIPAFGEACMVHEPTKQTHVVTIRQTTEKQYRKYCQLLEANGFEKRQMRETSQRCFAAYSQLKTGVFLNYYREAAELTLVTEEECAYFSYEDVSPNCSMAPQITQLHLEDFGMSYVIRVSDGRFIVLDGGRALEPDAERLMECLKKESGTEKPVIAAWILSHPHPDHYDCFFLFLERFGEAVKIEKLLFYFPEADDLLHYPKLVSRRRQEEGHKANAQMLQLQRCIREWGFEVYTPHTGQIYQIGDAMLEILACMDDTIEVSDNINAISLVIRMELGGQVTLWATDASFEAARLAQRYGEELKADILQVPHHGFGIGMAEAVIAGYRRIAPEVCLLPVSDYNAFTAFCAYRCCTEYLMTQCGVKELITGEQTRTLTLPYRPDPNGAQLLRMRYAEGRDNAGARTWIFTELNTGRPEDFEFTILNTTHAVAEVLIELFFEDGEGKIRFIKATILPTRLRKLCIIDGDEVERDIAYYNPWSIETNEIPKDAPFAVRFMSRVPVVISNQHHKETYRTSVCGRL